MIVTARKIDLVNGVPTLVQINLDSLNVKTDAVMAIDGSTSNSGVAILDRADGGLYACAALTREKGEEPVRYKVRFKEFIIDTLRKHREIRYIYYEEPTLEYATAIANLMMLRTSVEEIKIEHEQEFSYVGNSEENNLKWKKAFLAPSKVPAGSENQKKAVRDKLLSYMPMLEGITQDEVDAYCMGFAAIKMRNEGYAEDELQSKKKAKPFQYEVEFIGADNEEYAIEEFLSYELKVPAVVLENGLKSVNIGPRANFDKTVYEEMGQDDKLLIIGFPSDKHGDIILKYRIGELAAMNDRLYAFIWRKSRKR